MQVLQAKHPEQHVPDLQDPDIIVFHEYSEVPDPIPIDCTPATVESVAKKLMGAAGCSGVDSALLKSCLLRYGKASSELREELLDWTWWLANPLPPSPTPRARASATVRWGSSSRVSISSAHSIPDKWPQMHIFICCSIFASFSRKALSLPLYVTMSPKHL